MDGGAGGDGGDFVEEGLGVVAEVGLGEEYEGLGAGFAGEGEVAFEAAEVEVFVEGGAEEGDVDVGGEDLFVGVEASDEGGFSGEDAGDLGGAVDLMRGAGAEEDPVTDGGEVGADGAVVAEFAGDFRPAFSGFVLDAVGLFVFLDDAGGVVGGFVGGEGGGEERGPAEGFEIVRHACTGE